MKIRKTIVKIIKYLVNLIRNKNEHEIAGHKDGWPKTKNDYEEFWSNKNALEFYYQPERIDFYKEIMDICTPFIKGEVIDVGCGDGYFLNLLAKKLKKYDKGKCLTGLDYAESGLISLKNRLSKIKTKCADVTSIPFKDDSFDTVLLMETLEHIKEWKKAINECLRILKKNGYLIITVPNAKYDKWNGHTNFWTDKQFVGILRSISKDIKFYFVEDKRTLFGVVKKMP